jgi:hypothetical protein
MAVDSGSPSSEAGGGSSISSYPPAGGSAVTIIGLTYNKALPGICTKCCWPWTSVVEKQSWVACFVGTRRLEHDQALLCGLVLSWTRSEANPAFVTHRSCRVPDCGSPSMRYTTRVTPSLMAPTLTTPAGLSPPHRRRHRRQQGPLAGAVLDVGVGHKPVEVWLSRCTSSEMSCITLHHKRRFNHLSIVHLDQDVAVQRQQCYVT